MRKNNLAPVGRNQEIIFYKTEGIVDSAVDIYTGGIFTLGRFYVERNGARVLLQFFFNLMVFIDKRFTSGR